MSDDFTPFDFRKGSYSNWKDKVDDELLHIHIDLAMISARLKILQGGTSGTEQPKEGVVTDEGPQGKTGEWVEGKFYADVEPPESTETQTNTEGLVKATYEIRTATIAMRGYLMLLDQMHLSKDQKKMLMELQNIMMMVMKAAQVMRILQMVMKVTEAGTMGPMGIFDIVLMGGFGSASLAYGSKTIAGAV